MSYVRVSSCAPAHAAAVSGSAPLQHPFRKPPPPSRRTVSPKAVAPDTLENAANTFKGLKGVTYNDLGLGDYAGKKTSIRDGEMEFEEGEQDDVSQSGR